MGLLGQGVRAVIGLKNAGATNVTSPTQQSEFSAAYLTLSLMIGFIAGVLAGLATGLQGFITGVTLAKILSVAAAGYVGADFVENSMSLVIPKSGGLPPVRQGQAFQVPPGMPTPEAQTAAITASAPVLGPAGIVGAIANAQNSLSAALHVVANQVDTGKWAPALTDAFLKYDLNTPKRKAAAIGQFLVEAGDNFGELTEDLYYTHVEAIMSAFGSHFTDATDATGYLRNPSKLANKVYANRLGNGDEASGDGFRYCGRGLIQLTGKDEYTQFAATIGQSVSEAAAYCGTAEGAAMSGCWYLSSRNCLTFADSWDIKTITRLVNGRAMLGLVSCLSFGLK
jgi:predicted chitinase